jgi:hypothetical protein
METKGETGDPLPKVTSKLQAPVRLQLLPELDSFLFCIAVSFISVSFLLKKSIGNGPEGEEGEKISPLFKPEK